MLNTIKAIKQSPLFWVLAWLVVSFLALSLSIWFLDKNCSTSRDDLAQQKQNPKGTQYRSNGANKSENTAPEKPLITGGQFSIFNIYAPLVGEDKPGQETNDPKRHERQWMDSFICEAKVTDIALSWFTFLLVIVTAGVVWIGFRQEAQMRQLTRANVFVVSVDIGNIANPIPIEGNPRIIPTGAELSYPNVGPIVHLIIKNVGQTVAYDVVTWTNICLLEYPLISKLQPLPDEARRAISKSAIPPQGATAPFNRFQRPLTDDQIAALRAEQAAIYVYGETTYRDAYGKPHTTRFRYMHGAFTGTIGIATNMTICEDGNDAD